MAYYTGNATNRAAVKTTVYGLLAANTTVTDDTVFNNLSNSLQDFYYYNSALDIDLAILAESGVITLTELGNNLVVGKGPKF